ncbi:MAG: LacI family DNA-binding transcriptional regulator [Bryobacterales bacterium]|nr:LacI family DNA-binding transcriptional regulator [Bryobacterales bacterium]
MNLLEVAKRAGVSTATVSRVMNDTGGVRESTRRRVLAVAKSLHYAPNAHASALAKGTSKMLGVIVSNVENPFFLDIFQAMESAASAAGYSLVLENTGYHPQRLAGSLRTLLGLRPSGLALVVSEMEVSVLDDLARRGTPAVVYDATHPAANITSVRVRYEVGMRRAIEYLRSLGHRRMAFVGHHAGLVPLQERRRTFIETMQLYASDAEFTTAEQEDTPQGGRQAVAQLLNSGFKPTAILCVNDFMAIGALRGLRERGLRVPQDVSVTGFDNIVLSEYTVPALTTLDIPRWRIGRICVEALMRDPTQSRFTPETLIEPELVLRGSTGMAPKDEAAASPTSNGKTRRPR